MAKRFHAVADRLEVHAGDVTRPRFGLVESVYEQLCRRIDAIVHNAALVNHALSYAQLFEPNVLGTVEIIRLALHGRPKSLAFISSSAVAAGVVRAAPISENETAGQLWPSRGVSSGAGGDYAGGYGTSKWAAELLLRELHERTGLGVQIFRCGMILPHRAYLGQFNEGDNITRLLRGLLATGIAPRSFYRGELKQRHFDGIAVDVVAAALAAIALEASSDHRGYHVSNARWDDGVSLDSFVGWIGTAGHALVRIDDYAAWLREFRARLERLSEPERRRSPLPLIARWAEPTDAGGQIRLDNTRFRAALRAHLGIDDVPLLDEAYLHHCLAGLKTG
jgi:fatty acid CoA ligase FadD9